MNARYAGLDERTRAGDDYPGRLYVARKTGLLPSSIKDGTEMGSPLPTGKPEWWASETGAPRLMLPMDKRHGTVFGWAYADKRVCPDLGLSCYFQPVSPCAAPTVL